MRARSSQLKRWVAIAAILSVGVQPLAAFDTFWHSAATSAACRQFQFSADAANIVQFGNFSGPDFFGPLYDVALGEKVENWEKMNASALEKAKQFMVFRNTNSTLVVRKSAIFMHFDNLYGELNTNSKFDSLFTRLLKNTQQTIDTIYLNPNLNEGNKKMGILMALEVLCTWFRTSTVTATGSTTTLPKWAYPWCGCRGEKTGHPPGLKFAPSWAILTAGRSRSNPASTRRLQAILPTRTRT